jgi:transposase
MEITEDTYRQIEKLLPRQRGNVTVPNRRILEALVYRLENGCTWRQLPREYGDWHVIYVRLNRWAEKGVLERVYSALPEGAPAAAPPDVDSQGSQS